MRIIFRIDDIYLNGSIFELDLLKLFFEKKIPLTLGVIPFTKEGNPVVNNLDDKTRFYLDSGLFEIALHGYKHLRNDEWGEFYGISYKKQYEWIEIGKNHLEHLTGLKVTTFIPPWNAADINTLDAANSLGFEVVSLGHNPKTNNLKHSKISIIPYSVEHLYVLNTIFLKSVINLFALIPNNLKTAVVLFHPYNIFEWSSTNPYLTNEKSKFVISLHNFDKTLLRMVRDKTTKFSTFQELNTSLKIDKTIGLILNFIHRLIYRRIFKLLT